MDFKNPLVLVGLFATACYVLTLITRRVVEAAKPDLKKQSDENSSKTTYASAWARWWNQVILYAIAPTYGVALALFMRGSEYFPEPLRDTELAILFGMVAGFLCSFFFKLFKRMVVGHAGAAGDGLDKGSDPPPGS